MSREEKLKRLKVLCAKTNEGEVKEFIRDVIDTIERQPYADAISRQALTKRMKEGREKEPYKAENNLPLCEDVIHGDFTGVMDKE